MECHAIESNAFSKSKNIAIPGIFFILVKSIVSPIYINLIVYPGSC